MVRVLRKALAGDRIVYAGLAAIVVGFIIYPATCNAIKGPYALPEDVSPRLKRACDRLGLTLDLAPASLKGRVSYHRPGRAGTLFSTDTLAAELERYPVALVKCLPLRRILLCDHLSLGKEEKLGLAGPREKTLYFNVDATLFGSKGVQHVINHEIGHFIDAGSMPTDLVWSRLNSGGWEYKAADGDVDPGRVSDETPGFFNRYAKTSEREDKAETYALTLLQAAQVRALCERDEVLLDKVKEIDRRLRYMDGPPVGWPDVRGWSLREGSIK